MRKMRFHRFFFKLNSTEYELVEYWVLGISDVAELRLNEYVTEGTKYWDLSWESKFKFGATSTADFYHKQKEPS